VSRERWGLAILKELVDNALDACEQTDRAPVITVTVDPGTNTLSVQDNGPGLRAETLERSLDYTVRVSDKAYYVSPSRGQLGNAFKCLWALPYVLSGRAQLGQVEVQTGGRRYAIRVSVDQLAQRPQLTLTPSPDAEVKIGTKVTVHWPQTASWPLGGQGHSFYFLGDHAGELVHHYTLLNPQSTFAYEHGEASAEYPARNPAWPKWTPNAPTSPWWYTPAQFQALLGAFLARDRDNGGRASSVRSWKSLMASRAVQHGRMSSARSGSHVPLWRPWSTARRSTRTWSPSSSVPCKAAPAP
jgi:hypothetical protein